MKKLAAVLILLSSCALAQGTRAWSQSSFDDFERGTADGVAIRSDGALELAPAFRLLYTSPSTYVWATASDAQGNVYLAAGSPARVYKVTPAGVAAVIFAPKELQVQALVVAPGGALYAGTSPDGKVYRITAAAKAAGAKPAATAEGETAVDPNYTASVFFDPKTKYIWDLALDRAGRLYVATGDRGEIYRVTPQGEGTLFFKSDEAHIRVLALDKNDDLIAGSDGSGLVYRISAAGQAFVLYSAPKKEITALALDAEGNIYAAGVGEKRTGPPLPLAPAVPAAGTAGFTFTANATANPQAGGQATPPPAAPPIAVPLFGPPAGAEIYQIAPDGSPKRLWASRDDLVYALAFDHGGRLLAGSGNKGHIYVVEKNGDFTDLLVASATQVTGFAHAPGGGLYAVTSNLGKVFVLGSAPEGEGSYESDVFDAHTFSRWGRAEYRGAGNVELYARSGNVDNPDRNWSGWKKIDLEQALDVPAARFVQWKAVLRPGAKPAVLDSLALNYRPKNVAPSIDDVAVQVGARFQQVQRPQGSDDSGPVQVGGAPAAAPPRAEFVPTAYRDPDYLAIRWSAHDDNDDDLVYALYYRGDGETNWKLLKDNLTDKYYSTETALFPDGGYTVRVVASDAPSHSPNEALSDEKESAHFEIDTTPPVISGLAATVQGGTGLRVRFQASDSFSPIRRAEYSIDAGDWKFVEPVGLLSDAKAESYDFSVPLAAAAAAQPGQRDPGEHVVVVRVYDRYSNVATAKTVVHAR